jgi:hypothetical protein
MPKKKWFLVTRTQTIKVQAINAAEVDDYASWPCSDWEYPSTEDIQVEELPEDAKS